MIDQFLNSARARGQNVRIIKNAKEKSSNTRSKDVIVLVSDTHFEILENGSLGPIWSFLWIHINKIGFKSDEILVQFGKVSFELMGVEMGHVYMNICDILPRLLTNYELIECGFSNSFGNSPPPTPISIMSRLREKAKFNNERISASFLRNFEEILVFCRSHVYIGDFIESSASLQMFSELLPMCNSIKSLTIPVSKITPSNIDVIMSLFKSNHLEHASFEGSIAKNPSLVSMIKSKLLPKSVGVSFINSELSSTNLPDIVDLVTEKELYCLNFSNAFHSSMKSKIYSDLFGKSIGSMLIVLSLDNTTDINLKSLFESIPAIRHLSLSNCGLELSSVFQHISKSNLLELSSINLSKNKFSFPIDTNYNLNIPLVSMILNEVFWNEETMVAFFTWFFMRSSCENRLSVSNANASRKEWEKLFLLIQNTSFKSMNSLIWSGNPVVSIFFRFLIQNVNLYYLDLSGCLNENEKEKITSLSLFLSSAKSLHSFVFRGNQTSYLGKSIVQVLKSIEENQIMEFLDLSNNKCGSHGLAYIKTFISNIKGMKSVVIDGTFPDSTGVFLSLYRYICQSKCTIAVSYPHEDICHLTKSRLLSMDELNEIKNGLMILPDQQCQYLKSPFDIPCYIHMEEGHSLFPTFLPKQYIHTFRRNSETNHQNPVVEAKSPPQSPKKQPSKESPNKLRRKPSALVQIVSTSSLMQISTSDLPTLLTSDANVDKPSPLSQPIDKKDEFISTEDPSSTNEGVIPQVTAPKKKIIKKRRTNKIVKKASISIPISQESEWKVPPLFDFETINDIWDVSSREFSFEKLLEVIHQTKTEKQSSK